MKSGYMQVKSILFLYPYNNYLNQGSRWQNRFAQRVQCRYYHISTISLGLFKKVNGCVSDSPIVVYYWRIRHGCGIESEESAQLDISILILICCSIKESMALVTRIPVTIGHFMQMLKKCSDYSSTFQIPTSHYTNGLNKYEDQKLLS